ncbi:MAG: amidohydrolase family protein [bacterium]|nr:amidohydrolase family protein [bacterium]MDZ4299425.1 amidohydrolase family protein [Candidatus Sungbacteria bacterium]
MAYDILIKGGTVLDGSGGEPVIADVGITGDTIQDIGVLERDGAKTTINADGCYVTPGFIDITNHSDTHLALFLSPNLESMVMQGVTTIIGGNCGASLAPLASHTAIHAIDKWADTSKINTNWTTMAEFLEEMERVRPGVNFGTLVGYGTLRRGIIGNEIRLFNPEEREVARNLLAESIRAGAFGLSLGLAYGHERVSDTEEIIDIVRVLRETGGVVKIHLRSEGREMFSAINEAIRISRETEVSVQISHLKAIGKKSWGQIDQAVEVITRAQESGVPIHFDISPYATTGSLLYLLIPAWARQGGFPELFRRLDAPDERQKILTELQMLTLHYDRIFITSGIIPNIIGKTIIRIARETGLEPAETLLSIVRSNAGRVSIIGRTVSKKNAVRAIMDPRSIITSDGESYTQEDEKVGNLVHPRSFGAFPHFWHSFVTDSKKLTPANAIRKMTTFPAQKLGIANRGRIGKGAKADVVVFDKKLFRDRATYRSPFHYPAGLSWVIINGRVAVGEGRHMSARAGVPLRRG